MAVPSRIVREGVSAKVHTAASDCRPPSYCAAPLEPRRSRAPLEVSTVTDYYETLQISANAEPETIHRVYRLLAQRFHPDNQQTGNAARFRELTEAYEVLSEPARRAQYDAVHQRFWRERWKMVDASTNGDVDVRGEQIARLTLLELLYTRRRTEPRQPAMSVLDIEAVIGRPREHLEFSIWYLSQKKFVVRGDDSSLTITADGVEYLENNMDGITQTRLLHAHND